MISDFCGEARDPELHLMFPCTREKSLELIKILKLRSNWQNYLASSSLTSQNSDLDGLDMICDQTRIVTASIVDGVTIVWGLSSAQIVAPLPKQICGYRSNSGLLPGSLCATMICRTVLLKKTRFAGVVAGLPVGLNPGRAP